MNESIRCPNCGGYEDRSIDPEGCTCTGDLRAEWATITAEQIKVEPVDVDPTEGFHSYETLVDDQAIGMLVIDPKDVPIQVFSYMAKDGFFAESMVEALQGLASLHNGAL